MGKLIDDFKNLKWQRKIGVIILIYAVFFFVTEYNNVYLEQSTPCLLVNGYNNIPASNPQKTIITIKNNTKMPVFKIVCAVEDDDKEYENTMYEFFEKNNYIKKDTENAYSNGEIVIYIQRINDKIILEIVSEMKGIYK